MNEAPKKRLGIISDIVFDLVLKEFRSSIPQETVFCKFEDLALAFDQHGEELSGTDFLLIHCDLEFHKYAKEQVEHIAQSISRFSSFYKGTVILSGFYSPSLRYDLSSQEGAAAPTIEGTNILYADFHRLLAQVGLKNSYHYALGHLYQMPYTKPFIKTWAGYLSDYFNFLVTQEKKILVLDCDNTLWGGIVGEDGPTGIKINKNADGILYLHFQSWLKERMDDGFLLGICSKNNEADVKEAFDQNNLPLRWEDFTIKKINWEDKYANLQQIALELNLGLESFVFIDDNPFELESIKQLLPEISCVHLTGDYNDFLSMKESFLFKRKRVLQADKEKHQQYLQEQQRKQLREQTSFEDYIQSLNIVTTIAVNELKDVDRYAQMTEKTNQFNFNKIAYSPEDLKDFVNQGHYLIGLSMSDKFGDYGIIGLALLKIDKTASTFTLHNFLMSCRALGRNVENDFYAQILALMDEKGLQLGKIEFSKTERNKPAQSFLERLHTN